MPLVHTKVFPTRLSNKKLQLGKTDSEFIAVNNGTLVNVLHQLGSLVSAASQVFGTVSTLTSELGIRIRTIQLRLEELEVKAELFDPKLVPVPEGNLDLNGNGIPTKFRDSAPLETRLFLQETRPPFLNSLYEYAGTYKPSFPARVQNTLSDGPLKRRFPSRTEKEISDLSSGVIDQNPRNDFYRMKKHPGDVLVSVDVTGSIFDRMKANRRSLILYTKRIRGKKKRRNTICGSLPNKECGIQTSLHSVTPPSSQVSKPKYGADSGHWSSPTESPEEQWEITSRSNSSNGLFDDEDRTLTPQLENFKDGLVSDSDSIDTEGYFTSFRSECGFPKSRSKFIDENIEQKVPDPLSPTGESEYDLFGKGSTSTTASSCGTVVMRKKMELPSVSQDHEKEENEGNLEERVKRKSLIERVSSLVVITPSPSLPSNTPPPICDSDFDSVEDSSVKATEKSSVESLISESSTETLTAHQPSLPQPDVIADVYQLAIGTKPSTKLDTKQEYCSIDSLQLGNEAEKPVSKDESRSSGKLRGARVVLNADGEIIFSSETFRRKRLHKVSFDPGEAVHPVTYDTTGVVRERESVYDRIQSQGKENEELYASIQEIRRNNMKESEAMLSVEEEGKVLMETDLDSAIPPVMPELNPIPKIQDCLKRNESYRRATDEMTNANPNLIKKIPLKAKALSVEDSKKEMMSRLRREGGIQEEDPAFIHKVLSFGQSNVENKRNVTGNRGSSPGIPKFSLSPEDRPSFLRRESPPTMEEISKQIYHFRKKFNIQPIPISRRLLSPFSTPGPKTPKREDSLKGSHRAVVIQEIRPSAVSSPQIRSSTSRKGVEDRMPQNQRIPSSESYSSLSHFKRLLESVRNTPARKSVSAVEILKPRTRDKETIL